MTYRAKRYIAYLAIAIFTISLPFISIKGNQIFLLSFDHKELHLLGSVFNIQEFYVMPFLLILLFVGIFFVTTLLGRFWCGWACPQTIFRVIFRDLIEGKLFGLNKVANKQKKQDLSSLSSKLKKFFSLCIIVLLCFSASAVLLFYFVPPQDFFNYLANPKDHPVLFGFWFGIGAFFSFDIILLKENFCVYVCPYCRVQSVLFDEDTRSVIYDFNRGGKLYDEQLNKISIPLKQRDANAECIECQKCVRVCPTHIDIRAGMQLECINCLECVDACTSVMQRFKKPSLIKWSSPNAISQQTKVKYWRGKTIGYTLILSLTVALSFFIGSKKDDVLLNITRPTSLYTIHSNGKITNEYILLIENMSAQDENFTLSLNHPEIKILRPARPIFISKGSKKRVILVLQYEGKIQTPLNDLSIPIELKVSANKDLSIQKESVFIYPKERKS